MEKMYIFLYRNCCTCKTIIHESMWVLRWLSTTMIGIVVLVELQYPNQCEFFTDFTLEKTFWQSHIVHVYTYLEYTISLYLPLAKSYPPCLYLSRVYYIFILNIGKVISSMFMPICSILYFHTYSQRSQTFRRPYCPMIICRLLIVLDAAFGRVTHPKFWSSDLSSTLNSILTNIKIWFIFQCS